LLPHAAGAAVAPGAADAATASGAFKKCGKVNKLAVERLKAKGVSCKKAKDLAKRYVNEAGGGSKNVKLGKWRCTRKTESRGIKVECNRAKNKTVRFYRGG
jgi:hypothetical protein